jgi:hypothetical protein
MWYKGLWRLLRATRHEGDGSPLPLNAVQTGWCVA